MKAAAQNKKQHIVDTALRLFKTRGYEATTLRILAAEAGCSLGLTYKYFRSKDAIVLEFYNQNIEWFAQKVTDIPKGTLGARFKIALTQKLQVMEPQRELFAALFSKMVQPHSAISLFGKHNSDLRRRSRESYRELILGSQPSPANESTLQDLTDVIYILHFLVMLYWLHDSTPSFKATQNLLLLIERALKWGIPLLRLPGTKSTLRKFAEICAPLLTESEES